MLVESPAEGTGGGCYDCHRPYGDEHGFPDLIVPDDVWLMISPTGDFGGVLCPSCICKRLYDAGFRHGVEGRFMSGPLCNHYDHSWSPRPGDTLAPRRTVEEVRRDG